MKMIRSAAVAIIVGFVSLSAQALTLSIEPDLDVEVGSSFSVDLTIAGLGNFAPVSLGAFDVEVSFDSTAISFTGATFGSFLGDPDPFAVETITDVLPRAFGVEIFEVSLLSNAELDALQPADFVLATLTFDAIRLGATFIDFGGVVLSDVSGDELDIDAFSSPTVTVTPVAGTPLTEPSSVGLILIGLAGIAWVRRRKVA